MPTSNKDLLKKVNVKKVLGKSSDSNAKEFFENSGLEYLFKKFWAHLPNNYKNDVCSVYIENSAFATVLEEEQLNVFRGVWLKKADTPKEFIGNFSKYYSPIITHLQKNHANVFWHKKLSLLLDDEQSYFSVISSGKTSIKHNSIAKFTPKDPEEFKLLNRVTSDSQYYCQNNFLPMSLESIQNASKEVSEKNIDDLNELNHFLFYNLVLPKKSNFNSLFISIPVLGAPAGLYPNLSSDGKNFEGQGAIFIWIIFEQNNDGTNNIDVKEIDKIKTDFTDICDNISQAAQDIVFNFMLRAGLDKYKQARVASIKSAIAAIMSRNGSHNIGSHVLAALTHELSSVSDNQKLFQYIQQRMDFIAQITTEIPSWTYPAYFVQEIMRGFYLQRHLLNKIAESEGLSAYEFQPRILGEENKQQNKIIIKVKYNDKFIINDLDDSQNSTLGTQVQVAVPGGTVGYHAFYTIFENFIRNSAKHSWKIGNTHENLEIIIEIDDKDNNDAVKFLIYDNIPISNESIIQELNEKLAKSFISNTGDLRYENWGLAEMKIAVGYLNKMGFDRIGQQKAAGTGKKNKNQIFALLKEIDKNKFLAYSFSVPKPKTVALIGFDKSEFSEFEGGGIFFLDSDSRDRDYEFIVVKNDPDKIEAEIKEHASYPIRTLCYNDKFTKKDEVDAKNKELMRIKLLDEENFEKLKSTTSENDFIKTLYEIWLTLNFRKGKDIQWNLYVQPFLNASGTKEYNVMGTLLGNIEKQMVWTNKRLADNNRSLKIKTVEEIRESLNNIFPYIKSNFYKYDEDIETLPRIFRASQTTKGDSHKEKGSSDEIELEIKHSCNIFKTVKKPPNENNNDNIYFVYKRHLSNLHAANINYSYAEALSGAQFYFPLFFLLKRKEDNDYKKNIFLLQLLENALFSSIAIMDERFLTFSNREGFNDIFEAIHIIPTTKLIYGNNNVISFGDKTDGNGLDLTDENIRKNFYAIVIHQTILDNNFSNDVDKIKEFINELSSRIPYVIITSGRGKPDKLPSNAYFLPFATLEALILKQYPEKLLFTNIIHKLFRSKER